MKINEMGGGVFPYVHTYNNKQSFPGKETEGYEKKYFHPAGIQTLVIQPIS